MYTELGTGDSTPPDDKPVKQCTWCFSDMGIDDINDLCSDNCAREYQEDKNKMSNQLITVEALSNNALDAFTGNVDTLGNLLLQIEQEALSLVPDVSTAKGRYAIRTNATNVAKTKVRIDKEGKLLADKQKEIPRLIDASRKKARDFLEALQDKVREPLTDYEEKQKQDVLEAECIAKELLEAGQAQKQFLIDWDNAIFLNDKFDFEKEKTEIAKAKKAEQDEKDRLAREAELVEQGRIKAENEAKAAIAKAEREKIEAEQREKQAIEYARIAKDHAELAEKQRLIAEEKARVTALEKAEQQRLQAIEDERKRIEAEVAKQKEIEDKKAANKKHQAEVNNAIKSALIKNGFTEDDAVKIITLAAKKTAL